MMTSDELRKLFIDYCKDSNHLIMPSSSLIPTEEDKSLLFVNAGMVAFKPIFAGMKAPPAPNIASIQRCLRAGGKHNDLENVGYTKRHHTFFEMLGNFSFGGYFKKEAIHFAFVFLTQVLKLSSEKLWVTVYEEDQDTADIWLNDLGFNPNRLSYCGKEDNFWMMGETGPCGPCTEIFYDYGPSVEGGPPGSENSAKDRYVEIWNLVFMQYNAQANGQLKILPKPCIDTGMGLERLAAVMQGVTSNYDTDLFQPLMQAAAALRPPSRVANEYALKVVADHIRAIGFLMLDGIVPSNEGRGYVLRRIIRRALRHNYQDNIKEPALYQLIPTLVHQMQQAYPELGAAESRITQLLHREEEQFFETLAQGMQYFEKGLALQSNKTLSGSFIFKLYDTYGFPVDLTAELAREHGLSWDEAGFKREMEQQRQRSKAATVFVDTEILESEPTTFKGYTHLEYTSRIVGLRNETNEAVEQLGVGEVGYVILDETPFYAESGGQVGDQGKLLKQITEQTTDTQFVVLDTQKVGHTYLHRGYLKNGQLSLNDTVHSQVDHKRRQAIRQHHSATHMLHAALRELLGSDVHQKGSLVTADYLRFDFQYYTALTTKDIEHIEYRINQAIWDNLPVEIQVVSLEKAKQLGAIALFEQKYTEKVRVISIENFSIELCGGTHVRQTGELGLFKIRLSSSIAAGVKRIEAVVGEAAFKQVATVEARQYQLATILKTTPEKIIEKVNGQVLLLKQQADHIAALQQRLCQNLAEDFCKQSQIIGKITVVLHTIPPILKGQLRQIIDQVKSCLPPASLVVLGCQSPEQEELILGIGISKQSVSMVNAQAIVKLLTPLIDGKGGGRADFAQIHAKSGDNATLQLAFEAVKSYVERVS